MSKPTRAQFRGTLELTLTWGDGSTTVQEVQFGDAPAVPKPEAPAALVDAMANRKAVNLCRLVNAVDISPGTRQAFHLGAWARSGRKRITVIAATTTAKPTTATAGDFVSAELLARWMGHRSLVPWTIACVSLLHPTDPAVITWVLEGEQARRKDRSELLIDTCKRRLSELAAGAP